MDIWGRKRVLAGEAPEEGKEEFTVQGGMGQESMGTGGRGKGQGKSMDARVEGERV